MCSSSLSFLWLGHRSLFQQTFRGFKGDLNKPLRKTQHYNKPNALVGWCAFLCVANSGICDDFLKNNIIIYVFDAGVNTGLLLKAPWRYYYALKAQWLHSELGHVEQVQSCMAHSNKKNILYTFPHIKTLSFVERQKH